MKEELDREKVKKIFGKFFLHNEISLISISS